MAKCIDFGNWYKTYTKEESISKIYIQSCIECMSDDRYVQIKLYEHLDDTSFSSAEFIKISSNKYEEKFTAHFKNDNLVLSNRKAENYEYRGPFLQDELKNPTSRVLETFLVKMLEQKKTMFYATHQERLNMN